MAIDVDWDAVGMDNEELLVQLEQATVQEQPHSKKDPRSGDKYISQAFYVAWLLKAIQLGKPAAKVALAFLWAASVKRDHQALFLTRPARQAMGLADWEYHRGLRELKQAKLVLATHRKPWPALVMLVDAVPPPADPKN